MQDFSTLLLILTSLTLCAQEQEKDPPKHSDVQTPTYEDETMASAIGWLSLTPHVPAAHQEFWNIVGKDIVKYDWTTGDMYPFEYDGILHGFDAICGKGKNKYRYVFDIAIDPKTKPAADENTKVKVKVKIPGVIKYFRVKRIKLIGYGNEMETVIMRTKLK